MSRTAAVVDRDEWVYAAFDARNRDEIRGLVTPELIAEHERDPTAIHSDALQRVFAYFRRGVFEYFRRGAIAGKYVVIVEEPFCRYRIGVLGAARAVPIDVLDETYTSEPAVLHAIFLRRLRDLGAIE